MIVIMVDRDEESDHLGKFWVFSTISFRQFTMISFEDSRGGLKSTTCHVSVHYEDNIDDNNIDDNDASSLIMILVGEAWQWQQQWVNWSSWSFSLIGAQTWGWYDHCLVWSSLKDDDDMTSLSPSPPTTRDMLTIGFAKNFMSLYSPVNAFPCYKKVLFNKAGLETEWCQAGTVSFYRISCKACDTFYGKYNSARVKLSARVWLKYVQQ